MSIFKMKNKNMFQPGILDLMKEVLDKHGDKLMEPKFDEDSLRVLGKRYLLKDPSTGETVESPKELLLRVAVGVTQSGKYSSKKERIDTIIEYYTLMAELDFLPNSPTLMNAGLVDGQLAACYVLPVSDSIDGIYDAIKNVAKVHQSGGGTGMDFSSLRPEGDMVKSTVGTASGPVSFMKVFDASTEQIKQGGRRRGASMGMLRVDHPDILNFISAKDDKQTLNNFNISVAITDKFMKAVEQDEDYELINPHSGQSTKTLSAREVWSLLVEHAHSSGDPGIVFIDEINKFNPIKGEEHKIHATNPCGEQPLEDYEACNLGSINLNNFLLDTGKIDWPRLKKQTELSTRFLNDVIDAGVYPLPAIDKKVKSNRKIGLGLMGFADILIAQNVVYGSRPSLKIAKQIMKAVNDASVKASHELAEVEGNFPNWEQSIWADKGYGMRNATTTTIAPTGTISMIANHVSGGIEPVFALAYVKNVMDGEKFYVVHPAVQELYEVGEISQEDYDHIKEYGRLPEKLLSDYPYLVTAYDVTAKDHVMMQAAFQEFVHNAVSKTVNLPKDASVETVDEIYKLAYIERCKGVTIYRDGTYEGQVLTGGTNESQGSSEGSEMPPSSTYAHARVSRPEYLDGKTIKIKTGCGSLYITISVDENGQPLEVFCRLGKSGGCASSNMEVYGRLISGWLRAGLPTDDLLMQLRGISCSNPAFVPGGRVLSCADAVGVALERYLAGQFGRVSETPGKVEMIPEVNFSKAPIEGGGCPECGGPLDHESGCAVCKSCGYSKC